MKLGPENAQDLATVMPELGAAFLEVAQLFAVQFPGCMLGCAEGFRTTSRQQLAAAQGRSNADGKTSFSYHQHWPSMALDYAVLDPTVPFFYVKDGMDARYRFVGELFVARGFEWGGNWHKPDWDHVNKRAPAPDAGSVESSELLYSAALLSSPFLRA